MTNTIFCTLTIITSLTTNKFVVATTNEYITYPAFQVIPVSRLIREEVSKSRVITTVAAYPNNTLQRAGFNEIFGFDVFTTNVISITTNFYTEVTPFHNWKRIN